VRIDPDRQHPASHRIRPTLAWLRGGQYALGSPRRPASLRSPPEPDEGATDRAQGTRSGGCGVSPPRRARGYCHRT
jgi:hypothetical protein